MSSKQLCERRNSTQDSAQTTNLLSLDSRALKNESVEHSKKRAYIPLLEHAGHFEALGFLLAALFDEYFEYILRLLVETVTASSLFLSTDFVVPVRNMNKYLGFLKDLRTFSIQDHKGTDCACESISSLGETAAETVQMLSFGFLYHVSVPRTRCCKYRKRIVCPRNTCYRQVSTPRMSGINGGIDYTRK